MAGENNKNSVAESEANRSAAQVGDGGQTASHRHFKLSHTRLRHAGKKRLLITALILLVIAAGVFLLVSKEMHLGQKVYAKAAGHKIYESDLKQIKGSDKNISNHQAATVLADKYLTEAMAKNAGVSVTKQDIQGAYGTNGLSLAKTKPFNYQQNINKLYFQKLAAYNQSGAYSGEYLIANFSANIPYSKALFAEQKAGNPNLGNAQAIAADKKYAGNFITNLYNQVMAHKITFAQAIQKEQADPQVGIKAYPTQPHSGPFNTTQNYGTIVDAYATRAKLHTIKAGTTTKPFVAGGANIQAGAYYLVIRMDKAKGGPGLPYNQFLQSNKQKLGYKVYV